MAVSRSDRRAWGRLVSRRLRSIAAPAIALSILALSPATVQAQESAAAQRDPPATVHFWNRDLFTLRASLGALTPRMRAEQVEERLARMPESAIFEEVVVSPTTYAGIPLMGISLGPHLVVGLLPEDPDVQAGETLDALGDRVRASLRALQEARRAHGQTAYLVKGALLSLGATVLLIALCWAVALGRRRALARVEAWASKPATQVIRKLELHDEAIGLARALFTMAPWAAWLALGYLWATFVLTRFPFTQPWGEALGAELSLVAHELFSSVVRSIPGILAVIVIVLIARGIARAASHMFQRIERGQIDVTWLEADSARAARRLTIGVIWIVAIVVAYPYVPGSSSEAFKGLSVLIGLMISIGSSGVVNQVMSGFVVVMSRAVRTGDCARLGGHVGRVTEVGLLSVKLRTGKGEQITIPNAVVLSQETVNYTRLAPQGAVVVTTSVTIGYDAPWRQVHAMLLKAAERTTGLRSEPAPFVRQTALSDFYVEYVLVGQGDANEDLGLLWSTLHANIQDVFNEHGVQIMSPHFESQPAAPVVVPRERWHAPPAHGPVGA